MYCSYACRRHRRYGQSYQLNSLFSFESAFFLHHVHLTASEFRVKMAWVKFLQREREKKTRAFHRACSVDKKCATCLSNKLFFLLLCSPVIIQNNFYYAHTFVNHELYLVCSVIRTDISCIAFNNSLRFNCFGFTFFFFLRFGLHIRKHYIQHEFIFLFCD